MESPRVLLWLVLTSSGLRPSVCQHVGSTLGDFVKQLTSLISQNGGIGNFVNAIRPPGANPGYDGILTAGEDGYGHYPNRPHRPPQYPGGYPEYAPQYPDSSNFPGQYQPEYRPPYEYQNPEDYPGYPQTYAPGYNPYQPQNPAYPQQGLMAALASITRYDDLRCVPRLFCEVTSGGKPGYPSSGSSQQQATKETLTTVLTVLNFMDDNPLFVFGRAALLGAASRGNSAACLNAYPTCPRDPDRLVHYLNNHNGGFFRFFGGLPVGQTEARIQTKPGRALNSFGVRPADPQDYLPPSAHSSDGGHFVFPDSSSGNGGGSNRGGKHLFFPEEGASSHVPGSLYKPDFSPPQNLINFRDQRSVKFPAPMNFPEY